MKRTNKAKDLIYNCILNFTFNNNVPPTIREMSEITGYGVATIHYHLKQLIADGKIYKNNINGKRTTRCYVIK